MKNKNEKKKEDTKKKYAKKNLETEKRHENNVIKLNIEKERLAKETEEKEFKKYISFYFLRRAQENALKQKTPLSRRGSEALLRLWGYALISVPSLKVTRMSFLL